MRSTVHSPALATYRAYRILSSSKKSRRPSWTVPEITILLFRYAVRFGSPFDFYERKDLPGFGIYERFASERRVGRFFQHRFACVEFLLDGTPFPIFFERVRTATWNDLATVSSGKFLIPIEIVLEFCVVLFLRVVCDFGKFVRYEVRFFRMSFLGEFVDGFGNVGKVFDGTLESLYFSHFSAFIEVRKKPGSYTRRRFQAGCMRLKCRSRFSIITDIW